MPYFHGKVKGRIADISEYTREEEECSETQPSSPSVLRETHARREVTIQNRLAHGLIHSPPVSGLFQVFLELWTVPMDTV